MRKIVFIVERMDAGYTAFAEEKRNHISADGSNMSELRKNIIHAVNNRQMKEVPEKNIIIRFHLVQFFTLYKVINTSALAARIGISQSLLSQYANGIKVPSQKQANRILTGIHELGKELTYMELI